MTANLQSAPQWKFGGICGRTGDTTQVSIALQMVLMLEKVEYRLK
jgi:hypothetical protein